MQALKKALIGLVIVVLGVSGLAWHMLSREAVPEASDYVIDAAQLRYLAHALPGALPLRVNHQVIAEANLPRAAVFAGESFAPHRMIHGVHQIVYEDGFVLVDAGFDRAIFENDMRGDGRYDDRAFEQVARALPAASRILLTHEHLDHIAGLANVADSPGLGARVFMNAAQHANPETAALLPEALMAAIQPETIDGPRAIAPGVVVVPAAGHTPGSQLVYVRLRDEQELLLIGDVAWHLDAIRDLHYRPRLVTDWLLGEDRAAVMAQFRALHGLLATGAPRIVVSHDADQRREAVRAGWLGDGLELDGSDAPAGS